MNKQLNNGLAGFAWVCERACIVCLGFVEDY